METRLRPTYFISHGGGPWPWLKQEMPGYEGLEASLKQVALEAGRPKAILVVSGHWEERDFTVMANPMPSMIYDYGGFPKHTYEVVYGAPGDPALASRVVTLLQAAGFGASLDAQRGFDHGTFVPLAVMYPNAEVPVVQLSLRRDLDPKAHFDVGRVLAPLRGEDVLILGSGLSYHNLRAFNSRGAIASQAFDEWLSRVMKLPPSERERELLNWEKAPHARNAHPREDHLIPLMVALGAACDEEATTVYHERFMDALWVSSFRFGSLR